MSYGRYGTVFIPCARTPHAVARSASRAATEGHPRCDCGRSLLVCGAGWDRSAGREDDVELRREQQLEGRGRMRQGVRPRGDSVRRVVRDLPGDYHEFSDDEK